MPSIRLSLRRVDTFWIFWKVNKMSVASKHLRTFCFSRLRTSLMRIFAWSLAWNTEIQVNHWWTTGGPEVSHRSTSQQWGLPHSTFHILLLGPMQSALTIRGNDKRRFDSLSHAPFSPNERWQNTCSTGASPSQRSLFLSLTKHSQ